jgi:hypothetical protein
MGSPGVKNTGRFGRRRQVLIASSADSNPTRIHSSDWQYHRGMFESWRLGRPGGYMRGVRPRVELVLESNSLVGCPMSSSDCSNVIPAVGDRQGDSCLSPLHMGVSPWGVAGLGVNPNGASRVVMVAYRPDVPEAGGVAAHSVRNCVRLGSHVARRHRSSYSSSGVEGGGLSYPWLALSRRVRRFSKAGVS